MQGVLPMNLKWTISALAGFFALNCAANAADSGSWTGFLADRATVHKWISEKTDLDKSLRNYDVRAASEPEAVKAGYAIYANGKWLDLQQEKEDLIANLVHQSFKKKGLYVMVSGTLDNQTIHAKKIQELKETPTYEVK